jgi:3-hydroxy-D-aspartate aldolase
MAQDWRGPNADLIGRPNSRAMLDTPALVLDVELLDANIRSMAVHASERGYRLRPCVKTHKSTKIAQRQINAGAIGVSCATLAEAEVMVGAGVPGVFIFSPVVSDKKIRRLMALAERAKDLVVVADSRENVAALGAAARQTRQTLQVVADVEVGGGRTGIASTDEIVAIASQIEETDGLTFAGLQAYDGKGARAADYDARRTFLLGKAAQLSELVARLDSEGLHPNIVSGGGTASHEIDYEAGVLTEVQAGTYVFMDLNYLERALRRAEPNPFRLALTVRGTVVSAAQAGFVVTDVGAKEIDGFRGLIDPIVHSSAPEGTDYSIIGDDLGRIDFSDAAEALAVGAIVEIIPPHCFQTVAQYSVYHCVLGDELIDIWPIDARFNW